MSKRVNVNPGQYNVAGRERPGKDTAADINKQDLAKERAREAKAAAGNVLPQAPGQKKKTTKAATGRGKTGQPGSVPGAFGREAEEAKPRTGDRHSEMNRKEEEKPKVKRAGGD